MSICIILGTRPEIIKMSPIIRQCEERKLNYFILHTNQHYSQNLDKVFFDELELPKPKYNLRVGSGTHAEEIGKMVMGIEKVLLKEKPNIVLIEGDTNTVLAGAIAATKLGIKVGHVEAGLRSYDRRMPEEINRILTDHCSDFLFAPTEKQKEILLGEGISKEKIFVTGNTIVDAVYQNSKMILHGHPERSEGSPYFLLTVHRPENVDNKETFKKILKGIDLIFEKYSLPIIYPIHPRSKKMLEKFKLKTPKGLKLIDPVGFWEFLRLEKGAQLIFTDSGGVQEESCILKIPCVTLRDNTERPETIDVEANILAGVDPRKILETTQEMLNRKKDWKNPFGDGKTGERIVDIITN